MYLLEIIVLNLLLVEVFLNLKGRYKISASEVDLTIGTSIPKT